MNAQLPTLSDVIATESHPGWQVDGGGGSSLQAAPAPCSLVRAEVLGLFITHAYNFCALPRANATVVQIVEEMQRDVKEIKRKATG